MRPPGLEAMVSRRGDKAEACGAWQESGQINNCPLYSQREKNGSIQEQIHLSLWGFTRVSEKPHGQQSLSAGTEDSSRIRTDTVLGALATGRGSTVRAPFSQPVCLQAGQDFNLPKGWRSPQRSLGQKATWAKRGKVRLAIFNPKWGFLFLFNSWPVPTPPHKTRTIQVRKQR